MLSKSHLRRARAPAIVTGLLTASVVGVVVPSASALDISRLPLAQHGGLHRPGRPRGGQTAEAHRAAAAAPRACG